MIATETRPVQQGSRLTAFELKHDGFDVSLIPDTAVGYSMANGLVDKVVVGADRIVRTGPRVQQDRDVPGGNHGQAARHSVLCGSPAVHHRHEGDAKDIVIEMRKGSEVTGTGSGRTAPEDVDVINPAFDVTPLN